MKSAIGGEGIPQQFFRSRIDQFLRCVHCGRILAQKHRAVDCEVMIMGAVHRIDIQCTLPLQILAVCRDRLLIVDDDISVVPAEHIDMRRHVNQVTGVGHQFAQPVTGSQRPLREG